MNEVKVPFENACRSFGSPDTAEIWVIGHDPRLRESSQEAKVCFFLDLLTPGREQQPDERGPRGLATRVLKLVEQLTGREKTLGSLYATNLCNTFLEKPSTQGVILIDDARADAGIRDIQATLALARSRPKVIITMSQQVLYHLVRKGCLAASQELQRFQDASRPSEKGRASRVYRPSRPAAFVNVCGNTYFWGEVPVVPVLHVSSVWRMKEPYRKPMLRAKETIRALLEGRDAAGGVRQPGA